MVITGVIKNNVECSQPIRKAITVMKDMALKICFLGLHGLRQTDHNSAAKSHAEVILSETTLVCITAHSIGEPQKTQTSSRLALKRGFVILNSRLGWDSCILELIVASAFHTIHLHCPQFHLEGHVSKFANPLSYSASVLTQVIHFLSIIITPSTLLARLHCYSCYNDC